MTQTISGVRIIIIIDKSELSCFSRMNKEEESGSSMQEHDIVSHNIINFTTLLCSNQPKKFLLNQTFPLNKNRRTIVNYWWVVLQFSPPSCLFKQTPLGRHCPVLWPPFQVLRQVVLLVARLDKYYSYEPKRKEDSFSPLAPPCFFLLAGDVQYTTFNTG